MNFLDLGLAAVWGMLAIMLATMAAYLIDAMPEGARQQTRRMVYRVYCWAQNRCE